MLRTIQIVTLLAVASCGHAFAQERSLGAQARDTRIEGRWTLRPRGIDAATLCSLVSIEIRIDADRDLYYVTRHTAGRDEELAPWLITGVSNGNITFDGGKQIVAQGDSFQEPDQGLTYVRCPGS